MRYGRVDLAASVGVGDAGKGLLPLGPGDESHVVHCWVSSPASVGVVTGTGEQEDCQGGLGGAEGTAQCPAEGLVESGSVMRGDHQIAASPGYRVPVVQRELGVFVGWEGGAVDALALGEGEGQGLLSEGEVVLEERSGLCRGWSKMCFVLLPLVVAGDGPGGCEEVVHPAGGWCGRESRLTTEGLPPGLRETAAVLTKFIEQVKQGGILGVML